MFKNVCSLMCTLPDLVANEAYENTTVVRLDVCPIRHFLFRLSFCGTGRFRSHYVPRSSDPSSDLKQQLIGHWRKTTIVFESPKDEHLVLHAGGTADNWIVTAETRGEPVTGRWSVEGKTLTLSFGQNENSRPFTFYQGQLVFPNIPSRRGFWEKIE
jgi:hypothetical protein